MRALIIGAVVLECLVLFLLAASLFVIFYMQDYLVNLAVQTAHQYNMEVSPSEVRSFYTSLIPGLLTCAVLEALCVGLGVVCYVKYEEGGSLVKWGLLSAAALQFIMFFFVVSLIAGILLIIAWLKRPKEGPSSQKPPA